MVQLQFQCFIFKDVAPSKRVLEEFSKTHLTVDISKKTDEISLVEAVISKESSYKSDNRPEETLKVAKFNLAEVPSEKKPMAKTQKQTEIGPTRGMCDLDGFLFRILFRIFQVLKIVEHYLY